MHRLLRATRYAALMLVALSSVAAAEPMTGPSRGSGSDLKLWYEFPARIWEEALPVGNGRIGAMVYGGVHREHIQLSEETIWSPVPRSPGSADPAFREELRRRADLLFAGRYREAQDFKFEPTDAERKALGIGQPEVVPGLVADEDKPMFQPLGDLYLHFDYGQAREEDYRRELDLDTAVATTTYSVGGTRYTREVFCSHPAQALVVRVTADKPKSVSFTANLDYRRDVKADMYRYHTELPLVDSVATPPRPVWSDLGDNRFSWRGRAHPDGVGFDARLTCLVARKPVHCTRRRKVRPLVPGGHHEHGHLPRCLWQLHRSLHYSRRGRTAAKESRDRSRKNGALRSRHRGAFAGMVAGGLRSRRTRASPSLPALSFVSG